MQEEWWYASGDSRKGPVSLETLRQLLLERKVSEGTLVWKEGLESWAPLSEIPDLHQVVKAVPPELPKPTARDHLIGLPLAGPWRRFFARLVDLWVIALPTSFAAAFALSSFSLAFGLWIQRPGSEYAFGWLLLPLVLLVEVGIISVSGSDGCSLPERGAIKKHPPISGRMPATRRSDASGGVARLVIRTAFFYRNLRHVPPALSAIKTSCARFMDGDFQRKRVFILPILPAGRNARGST